MKTPNFDLRSTGDFLFRHCEKIVAACVGLFAVLLAWGGVNAIRTLSVTDAQRPEAVDRVVAQARAHIDREAQAPADQLPKREPLAEKIDPWRTPLVPWWTGTAAPSLTITAAPKVAVLDRPLFDEAAKRSKPDVFPIEDLRAFAGLAVLPAAAAAAPAQQPAAPNKPDAGAGRKPPRGGDALGVEAAPIADGQQGPLPKGRIVPYVVVTGLIPVQKQQEEYRQRFESCGFRDSKRDSPLWSDFEIDRGAVGPDGKETWARIDLAAVATKRAAEWGPAAEAPAVGLDPESMLGAAEDARNRPTTPLPFCSPLPQRLDGDWDLADLHPWFVERAAAQVNAPAGQAPPATNEPPAAGRGVEGPGFGATEERPPAPAAAEARGSRPGYRMFRFVDTDVAPGVTYRYRVRLKVWNPNWDKSPERMRPHLTDPSLAVEPKLSSPESGPSTAATVPDQTRILVDTLRPEEIKDLKIRAGSGTVEVLVLAPSLQTGSFALRALVADPGAVVDVDEKYNVRNQKDRARGEKVTTRRLLVDARGRQEERRDAAGEKGRPDGGIPEPLEVICLRPDGSFEFASVDGSERLVDANRSTLPPRPTKDPTASGASRDDLQPNPVIRPGGPGL